MLEEGKPIKKSALKWYKQWHERNNIDLPEKLVEALKAINKKEETNSAGSQNKSDNQVCTLGGGGGYSINKDSSKKPPKGMFSYLQLQFKTACVEPLRLMADSGLIEEADAVKGFKEASKTLAQLESASPEEKNKAKQAYKKSLEHLLRVGGDKATADEVKRLSNDNLSKAWQDIRVYGEVIGDDVSEQIDKLATAAEAFFKDPLSSNKKTTLEQSNLDSEQLKSVQQAAEVKSPVSKAEPSQPLVNNKSRTRERGFSEAKYSTGNATVTESKDAPLVEVKQLETTHINKSRTRKRGFSESKYASPEKTTPSSGSAASSSD